jgi:ornithine cyclodeaminase/alanine dehydrogenase-like protein (mu-crystallin family)
LITGDVITKSLKIKKSNDDVTLFKSVGNSLQDISLGNYVLKNCEKNNVGKVVSYLENIFNSD